MIGARLLAWRNYIHNVRKRLVQNFVRRIEGYSSVLFAGSYLKIEGEFGRPFRRTIGHGGEMLIATRVVREIVQVWIFASGSFRLLITLRLRFSQ